MLDARSSRVLPIPEPSRIVRERGVSPARFGGADVLLRHASSRHEQSKTVPTQMAFNLFQANNNNTSEAIEKAIRLSCFLDPKFDRIDPPVGISHHRGCPIAAADSIADPIVGLELMEWLRMSGEDDRVTVNLS